MKVRLNYGFSCKFKEHDIQSKISALEKKRRERKTKPLLLLFNWNTVKNLYFKKFNFKSKHRKKTRADFFYGTSRRLHEIYSRYSQVVRMVCETWKVGNSATDCIFRKKKRSRFVYGYNSIEWNTGRMVESVIAWCKMIRGIIVMRTMHTEWEQKTVVDWPLPE